ncbi:MAG TPA: ComEC/Rec2 family competence protein, partial [bacterium]
AEALAAAALAIVAADPRALFSASFQLSFAATAGLLLVAPRLLSPRADPPGTGRRWLQRLGEGARAVVLASLAASAVTAPLVAFHFQQVSLVGLPANLVAVPLTGFVVLPAAWAALGCAALPPAAVDAIVGLAAGSADVLIAVARWFAAPAWATVAAARPPALLTLAMVAVAATLLPPAGARWRAACVAALVVAAAGSWCWAVAAHGRELLVVFLDVGQGLSAAIRLPGGRMLLYDAGPRWDDYDAGERIVVPALRRLGAWRLEGFSTSHGHPDHAGGASAVRAALGPAAPLAGTAAAARGDERDLGGGVGIRVLNPRAGPAAAEENDRSLALLLRFGESGVVLTGDAGPAVAGGIVEAARAVPRHVVLQVPHHGGSPAACAVLAGGLRPEVSVIPVGRNSYGHPRAGAVAALEEQGRVLRTDRDGAVLVRSDAQGLTVRTWREMSLRRTWTERVRWLAAGW